MNLSIVHGTSTEHGLSKKLMALVLVTLEYVDMLCKMSWVDGLVDSQVKLESPLAS